MTRPPARSPVSSRESDTGSAAPPFSVLRLNHHPWPRLCRLSRAALIPTHTQWPDEWGTLSTWPKEILLPDGLPRCHTVQTTGLQVASPRICRTKGSPSCNTQQPPQMRHVLSATIAGNLGPATRMWWRTAVSFIRSRECLSLLVVARLPSTCPISRCTRQPGQTSLSLAEESRHTGRPNPRGIAQRCLIVNE